MITTDQGREEIVDFAEQGWFGPGLSQLLLTWGQEYQRADQKLAARWQQLTGPKKACFRNSADLALQYPGELTYVEGYAFADIPIPLPLAHAWLIDQHGRVVDSTWSGGHGYFGLPFSADELAEYLAISGQYGVLGSLSFDRRLRQAFLKRWPIDSQIFAE
jgi:hypothetical protein